MADLLQFPPMTRPAFAPSHPADTRDLPDPDARDAALDIQRSWIVEAPAGSGKTGLLIQRYLKLLAFGHVQRPGEVLVLTFTRKADGELRSRVLEQLTQAAEDRPLPLEANSFDHVTRELASAVLDRDRLLGWRLLASPAQMNIRTIDSFCAELTASMPLLAGGGGRRPPVDDAFPLYREAAERTLRALGGSDAVLNDALKTLLLHRDAQVEDCIFLIANMLANREQWGELIPLEADELTDDFLDRVVRPRLERTLAGIVSAGLQRAADALGPDNLGELARFAARLSAEPGYQGEPSPIAHCRELHNAPTTNAGSIPHWIALVHLLLKADGHWRKRIGQQDLKFEISRPDVEWLKEIIANLRCREEAHPNLCEALADLRELPDPGYPEEQWRVVKALCRILGRALAELQSVFMQRSRSDFTEIAMTARRLLIPDPTRAGPATPDPLNTSAARLTHLLVDEMQDTSAGQYQLLEALTEFWDGASQTVFLVGDPKQSIYAFRQARVERFLRTMSTGRLGDVPLGPLHFTANFRSQAALVQQFNDTFQRILPAPERGTAADASQNVSHATAEVPFIAATPSRQATVSPALHWHAYTKAQTGDPEPNLNAAREIRTLIEDFIRDWSKRMVHPGQLRQPRIAVLARNRAHLAPIITELRQDHGQGPVPFRAVDVEALNERPEVLDLLALTRALLQPADRVAWLAVLRSPMAGLSLPDLLALTGDGPSADRTATILDLVQSRTLLVSQDGQQVLSRAWPILIAAQNTLGRTSLSLLVERTWRSLGGDAPLCPEERTNAYRFLDLLYKLEAGPDPLSLSLLTHHLRKLYAEPMAIDTPVELMTIHKAKGLEWDLVLVPSLERGSGRTSHGLLKWLELDSPTAEANFLLSPIQSKGEQASKLSRWMTASETQRSTAEAKRLFYVACTRAREELHLFATVETKSDGALCGPSRSDSLLRAAWDAAEPILQQQLSTAPPPSHHALENLVAFPSAADAAAQEALSLAASGEDSEPETQPHPPASRPGRLPPGYDPLARFRPEKGAGLPYVPASELPHAAVFARPEGSFAARAFGNTIHRFLHLLSMRRAAGQSAEHLQAEVDTWQARLTAMLRNEGLAPALATTEGRRALKALGATLGDPDGAWLLFPHAQARSEAALPASGLRADRTFLAGATPGSTAQDPHLWIVDYKTAELGGRSLDAFLADQKAKYLPQMQTYAQAATAAGTDPSTIMLALYFPLLPALLYWPAERP